MTKLFILPSPSILLWRELSYNYNRFSISLISLLVVVFDQSVHSLLVDFANFPII